MSTIFIRNPTLVLMHFQSLSRAQYVTALFKRIYTHCSNNYPVKDKQAPCKRHHYLGEITGRDFQAFPLLCHCCRRPFDVRVSERFAKQQHERLCGFKQSSIRAAAAAAMINTYPRITILSLMILFQTGCVNLNLQKTLCEFGEKNDTL